MTAPETPDQRVVELETLVMYLQREVHEMNATVLAQQKQIDQLHKVLARFGEKLNRLGDPEEERSPRDERPPHY